MPTFSVRIIFDDNSAMRLHFVAECRQALWEKLPEHLKTFYSNVFWLIKTITIEENGF